MNRVYAAVFLVIFTLGLGCRVALACAGGSALFDHKRSISRSVDLHLQKLLRSKRRIEKVVPFHALAMAQVRPKILEPSRALSLVDVPEPIGIPSPPIFQPPI